MIVKQTKFVEINSQSYYLQSTVIVCFTKFDQNYCDNQGI